MRHYLTVSICIAGLFATTRPLSAQFGPNHPALVLDVGGHTGPIARPLFTADSKQLITVSRDKTIRFWDVATGRMLHTLRPPIGTGHDGELRVAALSPDGKLLAVAGYGFWRGQGKDRKHYGPVFVIDLAEGEITHSLQGHPGVVTALAFSSDGKFLASGATDHLIKLWEVATGKETKTLKGHHGWVTSLAFSPDGKRLVSAGSVERDGDATATCAWLWSTDGKIVTRLEGAKQSKAALVAWSPDGSRIVVAGSHDERFVSLWDGNGKHLKNLRHGDYALTAQSLAFTGDSKAILVSLLDGWRSNVFKIDVATGKVGKAYVGSSYFQADDVPYGPAMLSPDGRIVAVAADRQLRVHLYDAASGNQIRVCGGARRPPTVVGWVHEKDTNTRTIVWRTAFVPKDHDPHKPLAEHFFDRAFQLGDLRPVRVPEGADARFSLNRWGIAGLHLEWRRDDLSLTKDKKPTDITMKASSGDILINSVSFVGDDRAVFATNEGHLQLFDMNEKNRGKYLGHLGGFNGVIESTAPSPDNGHYLLASSEDQVLHIWNPRQFYKDDPTRVRSLPLMSLFVAPPRQIPGSKGKTAPPEWIVWTPEGYYTASAGGERFMGWQLNNGPDKVATFHPASRFRSRFYRPDVMGLLLKEGSLEKALLAAEKAGGFKAKDSTIVELAKVLPPEVTVKVSTPKDGKVEVTAKARALGAEPVVALQLIVDQRPWSGADGLKSLTKAPYEAKWSLALPPGEHRIRVLAKTASSTGSSTVTRGLVRDEEPVAVKPKPALFVLAIGVDSYPGKLALSGAVNDAKSLEQAFLKHSLPLFRGVETKKLSNKEATLDGMRGGLDWLKGRMTSKDVAVFFFAGHGCRDKAGEFYLLPQDGNTDQLAKTALARPEFKQRMQALPGRVLVLLDACNSGAIGLLFDDLSRELIDEDCGVVVMCAARPQQPANEKDGSGFFTRSVVGGLSGKAGKRDGSVYLHHLQQYVIDNVLDLSHDKQHPIAVAPPWLRPFELSKP